MALKVSFKLLVQPPSDLCLNIPNTVPPGRMWAGSMVVKYSTGQYLQWMVSQILTEQITEPQTHRIYWLERTRKDHWVNGDGVLAPQGFVQTDWGSITDARSCRWPAVGISWALSKSLLTQSFTSLISCLCSLSSWRSFWKEKFKGKKCRRLDVHAESSTF